MKIGAQLFTVREFCKDLDGFAESLKRVADIGYKYVQVSGVCEYDPHWLKGELDKNGLECVLTHIPPEKLLEDAQKVAKAHDAFGCKHIGLGHRAYSEGTQKQDLERFINQFGPVARALKQGNKYFMYHNHDQEFQKVDGKVILEHIADAFDPDELGFVLDVFWVQAGGGDPAYWLEKFNGRVPVIHLKDYAYGKKMAVIGEGNINFERIFEKAEKANTQYMMVEQDDCNGQDPFDCLKRSYNNLSSMGFK